MSPILEIVGDGTTIGDNQMAVSYSGATETNVEQASHGDDAMEIGILNHVVEHELDFKPQVVLITPYGNQLLWISDIGDTTFTVSRTSPSSSRIPFGWLADYDSRPHPQHAIGASVSDGDGAITIV